MSPPPLPSRRRKKFDPLPWAIGAASVVLLAALAYLIGRSQGQPQARHAGQGNAAPAAVAVRIQDEAEIEGGKEAVEAWLRENLDSGEWEEIRWWPPVRMTSKRDADVARMKSVVRESESDIARLEKNGAGPNEIAQAKEGLMLARETLSAVSSQSTPIVARLRFRTTNTFGANELRDVVFEIHGDQASPAEISRRDRDATFPD